MSPTKQRGWWDFILVAVVGRGEVSVYHFCHISLPPVMSPRLVPGSLALLALTPDMLRVQRGRGSRGQALVPVGDRRPGKSQLCLIPGDGAVQH